MCIRDSITVVQNAVNGQIPTTWDFRPTKSDRNRTYWINCSYSSISVSYTHLTPTAL